MYNVVRGAASGHVQPLYGKLHSPSGDVVGFQNIELISDLSFEAWEGYYKETKDAFPDRPLIASIMECYNKDRWQEIAGRAAACGVDALELNFSCPHGHPESGMGAAMGQDPRQVEEVTRWVVEAVQIPVWAKMTSPPGRRWPAAPRASRRSTPCWA